MQDSFHRNLIEEQDRLILFIGGGGKSALIRRLNDDCTSLGKKTAIFSLFPQKFPIESKTIIASDVENISRATTNKYKKSLSLHIGKRYENDVLYPFSVPEIAGIIEELDVQHFFLEADKCQGKSVSSLKKIPTLSGLKLDRCILVIGADALNQTYSKAWTNSADNYWKQNTVLSPLNIYNWYSENSFLKSLLSKKIRLTCFVNKVENTYTANLALVLAKELKKMGIDRVLTGSVYESALQVIK